jgi:hypothetical protein
VSKFLIVTTPDYFHGNMPTSLIINPSTEEKEILQAWIKDNDVEMLLYVYDNSQDIEWLLNVAKMSDSIYFNLDNSTDISYYYISYLVSLPKVMYQAQNNDYSIINKDRIQNIDEYIQRNWMG